MAVLYSKKYLANPSFLEEPEAIWGLEVLVKTGYHSTLLK